MQTIIKEQRELPPDFPIHRGEIYNHEVGTIIVENVTAFDKKHATSMVYFHKTDAQEGYSQSLEAFLKNITETI